MRSEPWIGELGTTAATLLHSATPVWKAAAGDVTEVVAFESTHRQP